VAVDGSGNVYIVDTGNWAVKEMLLRLHLLQLRHVAGQRLLLSQWRGLWTGAATSMSAIPTTSAVKELDLATPPTLSFANTNVGSQSSDSPADGER